MGLGGLGLVGLVVWALGRSEPPMQTRLRADAAAQRQDWPEAERLWAAVNRTDAADARSFLGEARAALALGRAAVAERALRASLQRDPAAPEPWLILLELLRLEDRGVEALSLGLQAYDAVPAEHRRALLRALTLALLADAPDELARTTLERWIAADPDDLDARAALDRRRTDHPRSTDPDLSSRVADLEARLARQPDHLNGREALILALAEQGQPARGRELLDGWPESGRDARYDRLRGRWALEYDHDDATAVEALGRALLALPHDWKTAYRRARALQRLGQVDAARTAAATVARLRETLDPARLGPRLDADLAKLDTPEAPLDLARLCDELGLAPLAAAWRRDAAEPTAASGSPAPSDLRPTLPGPLLRPPVIPSRSAR